MRIAITGPTGSIGSEMVRLALERGDDVIAILRPGSDRKSNLNQHPKLHIVECDISDYDSIIGTQQCDVLYHLAWMKTFGSERDDVYTQVKNELFALDAVGLAKSWNATAFVGVGSQAEYGSASCPLNESVPVNPTSGYGISKYATGKMCNLYCQQKGIRFNWARVLSVYGKNDADHTLIMYLLKTLLNGGVPELTKCEQIWDYIYSEDCARALLSIGDKGVNGRTYCIGSGEARPLREYVEILRKCVNSDSKICYGVKPYYPHQAMMLCADISDLKKDTGFEPVYTFEEGINEIIADLKRRS